MRVLHFSGLPEDYQVGPACLTSCDSLSGLLQPCCFCAKVNLDFELCAAGHIFCRDCLPPSEHLKKWCIYCEKNVDFAAINLPTKMISTMEFSCACTFSGTLAKIKQHLMRTDTPEICYNRRSIRTSSELEEGSSFCASLKDKVERLSEIVRVNRQSLRQLDSVNLRLIDRLDEVEAINVVLAGSQKLFCYRFDQILRSRYVEQRKTVGDVPLKVRVCSEVYENTRFLIISVAGSVEAAEEMAWPLKKSIVMSVHSPRGEIVANWVIRTFSRGSYTHKTFLNPRLEAPTHGYRSYIRLSDIINLYRRPEAEFFILSLEIEDLE